LGHQYLPQDLIAPVSSLTGNAPVMRKVQNWYFDLPAFAGCLKEYLATRKALGTMREVVLHTIDEFLAPPIIYVKNEFLEHYEHLKKSLPPHNLRPAEKGKASFELEFSNVEARESARDSLVAAGIRFRTGKTLVPFRITGNIAWGVAAPSLDGGAKLTVWCWPESLWAPISFTRACLEDTEVQSLHPGRVGDSADNWKNYWCSKDAKVYQFIGQDNIYFYGVAQTALWCALSQDCAAALHAHEHTQSQLLVDPADGELQQTQLIANYHLQFLGKKASSSGTIRPPMADELLEYYTAEQLRAHFMALGLGQKPVSFQPKPLNPDAPPEQGDPVLKEGKLLSNVLNRLARSCFYAAHNDNKGMLPVTKLDQELVDTTHAALKEYERLMYTQEFHGIMHLADNFIRYGNKYWADNSKATQTDPEQRCKVLAHSFYLLKAACLMMHPIAPKGTAMVFDYLNLPIDERSFFSWRYAFDGFEVFLPEEEAAATTHVVKELLPRVDFFEQHPSQFSA
jgi:methionyl-tRNA synthetase